MFAFDLYDQDSSGELSVKEIREMASDIYGKAGLKTNFHARKYADDDDDDDDDGIDDDVVFDAAADDDDDDIHDDDDIDNDDDNIHD